MMGQRSISRSSRGSTLIIAMSFIILLTLVGAMVLRAVRSDLDTAGAERSSQDALYIAEAGLQWGRAKIVTDHWNDPNPDYNELFNTNPDPSADALCDSSQVTAAGWRKVDAMNYGTGYFCVVAKDDEFSDDPVISNKTFYLRSLGVAADGRARRLLEVTVTTE